MNDDTDRKVRRTLHLRFTATGADPEQLLAMMRATAPFYQMFGNVSFRLLHNADDPAKFIQVIEYETPESLEANRQTVASDMRLQAFIQAWRAMLPGALEIDVYQEVGSYEPQRSTGG
jgi:quinol monooxygenase YgiN